MRQNETSKTMIYSFIQGKTGGRALNVCYGEYLISTDKKLLDYETIYKFLATSYWANKRSPIMQPRTGYVMSSLMKSIVEEILVKN